MVAVSNQVYPDNTFVVEQQTELFSLHSKATTNSEERFRAG